MRKVVFFDVDGTLSHMVTGITENTIQALKELKESGAHLVLCTGRSWPIVNPEIRAIDFDGRIISGGTLIHCAGKRVEQVIPPEDVKEVLDYLEGSECCPILCSEDADYYEMDKLTAKVDPWLPYTFPGEEGALRDLKEYQGAPINKICIKTLNREEGEKAIRKFRESEKYAVDVGMNPAKPNTVEIELIPAGCTKGSAVRKYIQMLGDSGDHELWAVGDGGNDVEMFRAVKYSVAMGNAGEKLKNEATYVTADFVDDGAAQAIRRWML